eukprot:2847595-Prymnesium_polylepis.1
MAFSGTTIAYGTAIGLVVRTATETEIGKIGVQARERRPRLWGMSLASRAAYTCVVARRPHWLCVALVARRPHWFVCRSLRAGGDNTDGGVASQGEA